MKPIDQVELHQPPELIGDCMRACIASILEVDPVELPHFGRANSDHGLTWESVMALARFIMRERYGVDLLTLDAGASSLQWLPRCLCVATGESPRFAGVYHDVVWQLDANGGHMVFDPHPSRAGILGRPVQFTFFIPLIFQVAA